MEATTLTLSYRELLTQALNAPTEDRAHFIGYCVGQAAYDASVAPFIVLSRIPADHAYRSAIWDALVDGFYDAKEADEDYEEALQAANERRARTGGESWLCG